MDKFKVFWIFFSILFRVNEIRVRVNRMKKQSNRVFRVYSLDRFGSVGKQGPPKFGGSLVQSA